MPKINIREFKNMVIANRSNINFDNEKNVVLPKGMVKDREM